MDVRRGMRWWRQPSIACRPIMLTAAAASLALVPIAGEIFWGPMAYAMIGDIIVGTVLTLVFLPALYVAWFRIKEPVAPEQPVSSETATASPDLMPRSWP